LAGEHSKSQNLPYVYEWPSSADFEGKVFSIDKASEGLKKPLYHYRGS